jgi:hypothetical protein
VLQKDVNDFLDIRRKDAERIEELEAVLQQIALDTANNTNLESHYASIAREALAKLQENDDENQMRSKACN